MLDVCLSSPQLDFATIGIPWSKNDFSKTGNTTPRCSPLCAVCRPVDPFLRPDSVTVCIWSITALYSTDNQRLALRICQCLRSVHLSAEGIGNWKKDPQGSSEQWTAAPPCLRNHLGYYFPPFSRNRWSLSICFCQHGLSSSHRFEKWPGNRQVCGWGNSIRQPWAGVGEI